MSNTPTPINNTPIEGSTIAANQEESDWRVHIFKSCWREPFVCCRGCVCPARLIYLQRKRLLVFTGEPYSCLQVDSFSRPAGCCCCCGCERYEPPQRVRPTIWPPVKGSSKLMDECQYRLCCESFFLPGAAILANRRLAKQHFHLRDPPGCISFMLCGSMCGSRVGLGLCADLCTGCLLTQVHIEMKFQEEEYMKYIQTTSASPSLGSGPSDQTMSPTSPASNIELISVHPNTSSQHQTQQQSPPYGYSSQTPYQPHPYHQQSSSSRSPPPPYPSHPPPYDSHSSPPPQYVSATPVDYSPYPSQPVQPQFSPQYQPHTNTAGNTNGARRQPSNQTRAHVHDEQYRQPTRQGMK